MAKAKTKRVKAPRGAIVEAIRKELKTKRDNKEISARLSKQFPQVTPAYVAWHRWNEQRA